MRLRGKCQLGIRPRLPDYRVRSDGLGHHSGARCHVSSLDRMHMESSTVRRQGVPKIGG